MTPRNDSSQESSSYPDEPNADPNLPGEMLADGLADPGAYDVAPDEREAEELQTDASGSVRDGATASDVVDETQLAAAEGAAARARSSRPKRRVAEVESAEPVTRGRGARTTRAKASPRGTTPAQFVRESGEELRKVVWPTWSQVQQLFWAVLVLVLFVIAFVGLLDLGFGWALLRLFG
ncbi:MAG: preprotein translocase subunit SecE [Propionibacteriaceae bacterium]|nr:preprotein translocase subunit SecE [Propionibacteriaceae bacterium]